QSLTQPLCDAGAIQERQGLVKILLQDEELFFGLTQLVLPSVSELEIAATRLATDPSRKTDEWSKAAIRNTIYIRQCMVLIGKMEGLIERASQKFESAIASNASESDVTGSDIDEPAELRALRQALGALQDDARERICKVVDTVIDAESVKHLVEGDGSINTAKTRRLLASRGVFTATAQIAAVIRAGVDPVLDITRATWRERMREVDHIARTYQDVISKNTGVKSGAVRLEFSEKKGYHLSFPKSAKEAVITACRTLKLPKLAQDSSSVVDASSEAGCSTTSGEDKEDSGALTQVKDNRTRCSATSSLLTRVNTLLHEIEAALLIRFREVLELLVLDKVRAEVGYLYTCIHLVNHLDMMCAFASFTSIYCGGYAPSASGSPGTACVPTVITADSGLKQPLELEAARHPLIEYALYNHNFSLAAACADDSSRSLVASQRKEFVPYGYKLSYESGRLQIITAPNGAGKSTYLTTLAVNIVLAQIGCLIPARRAKIQVIQMMFVRSGGIDDSEDQVSLSTGQSSFSSEMTELSDVLENAGASSSSALVLLDELGRGTSHDGGAAICWATCEFLLGIPNCRVLLSTHFHYLTNLEKMYPEAVSNVTLKCEVAPHTGSQHLGPEFKVDSGKSASSCGYGIALCRAVGMPKPIVEHAEEVLPVLAHRTSLGGVFRPTAALPALDISKVAHVDINDPVQAKAVTDK
ncbi:MutS protein msh4, partial [Perkinsus olseni]